MKFLTRKIALLVTFFWSGSLWALNVDLFRPAFDRAHNFLVYHSKTLSAAQGSAGYYFNYAKRVLEIGNIDNHAGVSAVIDDLITMGFVGGYGITDHWSLGMSLPLSPFFTFQEIGSTVSENKVAMGDMTISSKYNFWSLNSEREVSEIPWMVGAAVVPEISLPTGRSSQFLGNSNVTGTLKGILDVHYAQTHMALNLGFRIREKEDFLNLSVGQEFVYGVGISQEVWADQALHVTSEFVGSTTLNSSPGTSNNIPMEWLLGADKIWSFDSIPGKFSTSLGTSLGVSHGYGTPTFRMFGIIRYVWGN